MSVTFRNFKANDYRSPLTLEEIFKLYGSWSGIHNFSFDDLINVASTTTTGLTASQWNIGTSELKLLPPTFEIRYHKTVDRQGCLIRTDDGSVFIYVTTNSSGYPEIYRWGSLVQSTPKVCPTEADVRIVFRQQQNTDDQTQVWQSISLYMNDALITTYNVPWNQVYTNFQVGFLAYGTDSVTYTNLVVPELCDIAEFGTLDPGATPTNGLQQTIEGRYLKYFVRFDGSLRAWKVKSISSQHTYSAGDFYSDDIPVDLTNFATHVRMMGAWLWSEVIDTTLADKYGERFQEINNSMLLTKRECFIEAGNSIKRSQEGTFSQDIDTTFIPKLETEDRITTPEGDWIITGYSVDLELGELRQQLNVRQYVWG